MKRIGIVVCNYNKENYVVQCVQSLLEQTIQDFDIYVVDNASEDDSVKAIQENFGTKVNLLINQENLGGSGGFNTGLREALKHNYEYLMCVDNDVRFAEDTVEQLLSFLETHDEVGMVGSCCYFMDAPERIWSYGAEIDFEKYVQVDLYRNCLNTSQVPDVVYCTYVPACAMMLRTSAVREVGIMPEENFIYWDDMEWGYRFNQAGYKVAAYKKAQVWHKGGGRNGGTTFNNYYMWRNRLRFFMKTLSGDSLERFAEEIINDLFRLVYSCHLKGDDGVVKTVMHAFNDAVNDVEGKAPEYKIFERKTIGNRVQMALDDAKNVLIRYNGDTEGLGNIVRNICSFTTDEFQIAISVQDCPEQFDEISRQYKDCEICREYLPEAYEKHLVMCEHIFNLTKEMEKDYYIDSWCNIVFSEDDFEYARNFEGARELFLLCKKELLLHAKGM